MLYLCYNKASFPVKFALQVFIPINMVCEVIFVSPVLYDQNFQNVVSYRKEKSFKKLNIK